MSTLDLPYNNFSLKVLVKWDLSKLWGKLIPVDENIWDIFLVINQKVDETNFKRLTHWFICTLNIITFNSDISVGNDALLDNFLELKRDFETHIESIGVVVSIIVGRVLLSTNLEFCYR